MTWVARFDDGPAWGTPERIFVVGEQPWERIVLMGFDTGFSPVLIGGDEMPPNDTRWPDQADYVRVSAQAGTDELGETVTFAHYRWVPDA